MSIYHVTQSTGQGAPIDRTLFVGATIPDEIKALKQPLKKIDKPTLRKILQSKYNANANGGGGSGQSWVHRK